jgi:hypothetical protein
MVSSKYEERLTLCMGELLNNRQCVYNAESMDELTEIVEAVALHLEEREQDFHYFIEGSSVTFQLHNE